MFAPEQNTRSRSAVTTQALDLRVLEAQPLDRIGQLDIDRQVIASSA
jgi:hypothetical protein